MKVRAPADAIPADGPERRFYVVMHHVASVLWSQGLAMDGLAALSAVLERAQGRGQAPPSPTSANRSSNPRRYVVSNGKGMYGGLNDGRPALHRFTLHLDFLAEDEQQARHVAAAYAEGLNQLRPEVDGYTACVSPATAWSSSTAVFCGVAGPDETQVCVDAAGHAGLHHGPGGGWPDA